MGVGALGQGTRVAYASNGVPATPVLHGGSSDGVADGGGSGMTASGGGDTIVHLLGQATEAQAAAVQALDPLPVAHDLFARRVIDVEGSQMAVAQDVATPGVTATVTVMTATLEDSSAQGLRLETIWTRTAAPVKPTDGPGCEVGCEAGWEAYTELGGEACLAGAEVCVATIALGYMVCDSSCSTTPAPSCDTSPYLAAYPAANNEEAALASEWIQCYYGAPDQTISYIDLYTNLGCDSGCSGQSGYEESPWNCVYGTQNPAQTADCSGQIEYYCPSGSTCYPECLTEYEQWNVYYTDGTLGSYIEYVNGQSNEACN